jgi:hypothetical protein
MEWAFQVFQFNDALTSQPVASAPGFFVAFISKKRAIKRVISPFFEMNIALASIRICKLLLL